MSIEIEKKFRLREGDRERVISRLEESGAEFIGREFEENTIFLGDVLGDRGAIIRLRKTETRTVLTYKRRVESEFDVKQQIEHEIEVSNADVTAEILAELGLHPRIVYEKYRDTWKLRSVEVVLDELPFGSYMEIEGTVTGIKEAEILVDLEDFETEHDTYPRLTTRLGTETRGVVEARFRQAADVS